ncbi:hypothetical protein [Komagataeibacter sp. FNDCR2]|uniref:hypothetical protein n=1 Tax=Komagataeibacter sp. FNDCR2 TaxID=2878682 RepID=UPI001E364720|nr:hypothetical protein [Komagataeibacter sp. FNDCR2]MCE2575599.1 hypothetical protein [Komagataeibacter sp. FNDCR2]
MPCIPVILRYGAGGLIWIFHFVLLMTVAATTALAAGRNDQASACKGDVFRLCFLDIPNEKLMTECLESKLDQLTPKCRAMFEEDEAEDTERQRDEDAATQRPAPVAAH